MRYKTKYAALSILTIVSLSSCDGFLKENIQNGRYGEEIVWSNPKLAEGVLLKAYQLMPGDYTQKTDYGTDDMVTNLVTDNTVTMATGGWTSRNSPFSNDYSNAYKAIMHINDFLENMEKVNFAQLSDPSVDEAYHRRLKGEAYALRAWWEAGLLKEFGGEDADGNLLGFPILCRPVRDVEKAKIPRSTYTECVRQILADCDSALMFLPLKWEGSDRVMGSGCKNRINGLDVMALKSRVLLTAASPAFAASGYTMREAADAAASVMNQNGGISNLDPRGLVFYSHGTGGVDYLESCNEVFWYSSISASLNRETRMFPPTLFGQGEINPSQNLVNCFPMRNGYPIDDAAHSGFNATAPFAGRDPRLDLFIYHNGSSVSGIHNVVLNLATGLDAIGGNVYSTRTGYYMRKLLDENVKLDKNLQTSTNHYIVRLRYTETLLNFAEAANAVVGPDTQVGGFTAREVVNALRTRAGITGTDYVDGLDRDGLAALIRNERRLELCFEGFRFWDLRRWNDVATMNENISGYDSAGNSVIGEVEVRKYEPYMIYAPIPYSETEVYGIVQNRGWE